MGDAFTLSLPSRASTGMFNRLREDSGGYNPAVPLTTHTRASGRSWRERVGGGAE